MNKIPFRALVDDTAPEVLARSGFHYTLPEGQQRYALWNETLGDVALTEPPDDAPNDLLYATINSPDLAAVLVILEASLV